MTTKTIGRSLTEAALLAACFFGVILGVGSLTGACSHVSTTKVQNHLKDVQALSTDLATLCPTLPDEEQRTRCEVALAQSTKIVSSTKQLLEAWEALEALRKGK